MLRLRRRPEPVIGYDSDLLADVIAAKTAALDDPAIFEAAVAGDLRLPTLLAVAISGDRVLDFGGACGLHYRVAKHAFPEREFRWAVVETPQMVGRAAAGSDLRFFTTIDGAADWLGGVDLVHSTAALQAAPDALEPLAALGAPVMLWAKLLLGRKRERFSRTSRLSENGPGPLPRGFEDREVSYELTRIESARFHAAHHEYRVVWHDGDRAFLFAR